jgi:hypothetical protein
LYLDSEHDYNDTYDAVRDEYYAAINQKRDVLPNPKDKASAANPAKQMPEGEDDGDEDKAK